MAMARLTITSGPRAGERFDLADQRTILGRHPDCDVVLDAAAVSRQHAQLVIDGSQCYVEDLHSRNGTFLNEQLVESRSLLHEGDQLRVCDITFEFLEGGASATIGVAPANVVVAVPLVKAPLPPIVKFPSRRMS